MIFKAITAVKISFLVFWVDTVQSGRLVPKFQRNILLPSSVLVITYQNTRYTIRTDLSTNLTLCKLDNITALHFLL